MRVLHKLDDTRLQNKCTVELNQVLAHLRLGLGHSSMLASLFTETGPIPLKFRRLSSALQYLMYLLALPPQQLAHKALLDSIALDNAGQASWVMDLRYVITLNQSATDFHKSLGIRII